MCFSLGDQILLFTWDLDLSHRNAPNIIVCDWLLIYPTRGGGTSLSEAKGDVPLAGWVRIFTTGYDYWPFRSCVGNGGEFQI